MSRTHAHVPAEVELARLRDKSILKISHRIWTRGDGPICCMDGTCYVDVPRWASSRRWSRRGTAVMERRTAIDNQLRQAIKEYRTTGDVDTDVYTDPETFCLCEYCSGF